MITLIHGENLAQSRDFYLQFKKKYPNQRIFEGEAVNATDLIQSLEGKGLFNDAETIFLENFLSKRKQSSERDLIIDILASAKDQNIILWEQKEIGKKDLGKIKNIKIEKFDLPKIIFKFLDSIEPNNGQSSIKLFHETLETESAELLFFMIVRKFRILLGLSNNNGQPIDEVKNMQPWQQSKVQKQANDFGQDRLLDVYNKLFYIESSFKVGLLPTSLINAIDFLLLEI